MKSTIRWFGFKLGAISFIVVTLLVVAFWLNEVFTNTDGRDRSGENGGRPPRSRKSDTKRPTFEDRAKERIEGEFVKVGKIPGPGTLARLRKARQTAQRPHYSLFGADGVLTQQAITDLKLTDEESIRLQKINAFLMDELRDEAAKAVKADVLRANADKGVRAMTIAPFEVGKVFDIYSNNLVNEFGRQRAGEILISFPVERYYGQLGKNEVSIQVFGGDVDAPEAGPRIELQERDPESGELVRRSSMFASQLDRYPGLFDSSMNVLD